MLLEKLVLVVNYSNNNFKKTISIEAICMQTTKSGHFQLNVADVKILLSEPTLKKQMSR